MFIFAFISLLIFDTLIRVNKKSKLKIFWSRYFPQSIAKKISNIFGKIQEKMMESFLDEDTFKKIKKQNDVSLIEEFILMINPKYSNFFFVCFILFTLLSIISLVHYIIIELIPLYIKIFGDLFG